jgi:hypothetical protein
VALTRPVKRGVEDEDIKWSLMHEFFGLACRLFEKIIIYMYVFFRFFVLGQHVTMEQCRGGMRYIVYLQCL